LCAIKGRAESRAFGGGVYYLGLGI
jgi:hypothetical protein